MRTIKDAGGAPFLPFLKKRRSRITGVFSDASLTANVWYLNITAQHVLYSNNLSEIIYLYRYNGKDESTCP